MVSLGFTRLPLPKIVRIQMSLKILKSFSLQITKSTMILKTEISSSLGDLLYDLFSSLFVDTLNVRFERQKFNNLIKKKTIIRSVLRGLIFDEILNRRKTCPNIFTRSNFQQFSSEQKYHYLFKSFVKNVLWATWTQSHQNKESRNAFTF